MKSSYNLNNSTEKREMKMSESTSDQIQMIIGLIDSIDAENLEDKKVVVKGQVKQMVAQERLKERLSLLYDYAKKNLELIQEHSDEIKFATSVQQDLRKERTQFFSQSLKEVSGTLRDAQVSEEVASKWIMELVNCYTNSLDQSSNLVQDHAVELLGAIKRDTSSKLANSSKLIAEDE